MTDEIEQLDAEFAARTEGRRATVEESREYWRRLHAIHEKRATDEMQRAIAAAVDTVMTPRGVFVKDLGQNYFWLRPRSDKGLEFRLLLELDKKLPQGKGIARILEKNKGFVIVIG